MRERPCERILFSIITLSLSIIICCGVIAAASADNPKTQLSGISEIGLHRGVNKVKLITAEPGDKAKKSAIRRWDAIIVAAEVVREGTGSYVVFLSMLENGSAIPVEAVRDDPDTTAVMANHPGDGENSIRSVRFFNAKFNGESSTVLVDAERDLNAVGGAKRAPTNTRIRLLRLVSHGDLGLAFRLEAEFVTDTKYVNADVALCKELHIPLSATAAPSRASQFDCGP